MPRRTVTPAAKHPAMPGGDSIRAELIALMFRTMVPLVTIGGFAVALSALAAFQNNDALFALLSAVAAGIVLWRVTVVAGFRRERDPARWPTWEWRFAVATVAFSAVLAAIGGRAFYLGDHDGELMAAVLIIGYCAGIVTRVSFRPMVAIAALLTCAVPLLVLILWPMTPGRIALGLFIAGLIAVSIDTVRHSYRITLDHLQSRLSFARRADVDALTSLPNRAMLMERLSLLLGDERHHPLGIHFIDLDHFKEANDTFGHGAGDSVLAQAAERLRRAGGPLAFVARYGGDEFVLIQSAAQRLDDVQRLGDLIVELVSKSYCWDGIAVRVGTSVGAVLVDGLALDSATVLAAADQAMMEAKRAGRGRAVVRDLLAEALDPLNPPEDRDPAITPA